MLDHRRTIAEIAPELSINDETVSSRLRQDRIDRGEREGLTSAERKERTGLGRQLQQVTMERDVTTRRLSSTDPGRQLVTRDCSSCSQGRRRVAGGGGVSHGEDRSPYLRRPGDATGRVLGSHRDYESPHNPTHPECEPLTLTVSA